MSKHIVLAGSMFFMDKMTAVANDLESLGFSVTCPELTEEEKKTGANTFTGYVDYLGDVEKVSPDDPVWKMKGEAIREYKKVIDVCDALLICNFDKGEKKNYIGANSFIEMGYGFFINKPIFILQGPPYADSKIEEVLGMTPIFLYGNLGKIKESL
jgi:hypothetical protein